MKLTIFFIFSALLCINQSSHAQDTRPTEKLQQEGDLGRDSATTDPVTTKQTILKSCWSDKELEGDLLNDKKIVRPYPSDNYIPTEEPRRNQRVKPELQNCIRRVNPTEGQKLVALTFDLCERLSEKTGYDAEIVNYLRKNRVKATF